MMLAEPGAALHHDEHVAQRGLFIQRARVAVPILPARLGSQRGELCVKVKFQRGSGQVTDGALGAACRLTERSIAAG
jgi:hypothetical protein